MKYLFIGIAMLLSFRGLAQTAEDSFKTGRHQLVIQGLSEECIAAQTSALNVKAIELEKGKWLEYAEQGNPQGMPVVLLHGITDSWHSFEKVLSLLPPTYHVFAISQRGHGNSDKTFHHYRPKHFAADVAAFTNKLHTGPAVIVGHSMGGVVAQQFAIDHPHLTKGLVIISSEATFSTNTELANFYAVIAGIKDPLDKNFICAFQKSTIAKPIPDAMLDMVVAESLKVPAAIFKSAFKGLLETKICASLHAIKAPALIVWGDKDSFCFLAGQMKMRKKIKGSRLIIYSGTGHALHWEEPERFTKDLLQFLETIR